MLGVSGSVAAVKAPEIAVNIIEKLQLERKENDVKVRVLLTKGGTFFWKKSYEYNPHSWDRMKSIQEQNPSAIEVYGEIHFLKRNNNSCSYLW